MPETPVKSGRIPTRALHHRARIRRRQPVRRGFTLVELLVVIVIILLLSVTALPTIIPAINHRQVSEAARILQASLVGARDKAIHDGAPSGIRLLPGPLFDGVNPATGRLDPNYPLAFDRIVPIGPAPEYSEGMVSVPTTPAGALMHAVLYQVGDAPWAIPGFQDGVPGLLLEEAAVDAGGAPNPPTSWAWNVRVGDKIQVDNAGPWYTVVGPTMIPPGGGTWDDGNAYANPEGFVNYGPPGWNYNGNPDAPPWPSPLIRGGKSVEFLMLVNGLDDNRNGWRDEGWDGVDNNGNGVVDEHGYASGGATRDEWEIEAWAGAAAAGVASAPYVIRRRPAPTGGAREVAMPTSMVIDATTWGNASPERSRLPVESGTGAVDIMVNPDGTAYFQSMYGVPSRYGMGAASLHFWLAERQDVVAPATKGPPCLPVAQPGGADAAYTGPTLKGEYALLTLFARSGQVSVNVHPPFDDPLAPADGSAYNPSFPFLEARRGASGAP